jgi:hypothetical protein
MERMLKLLGLSTKQGKLVGRHNARQIAGFRLHLVLRINGWDWLPSFRLKYHQYIHWLCFFIYWEYEYGDYIGD